MLIAARGYEEAESVVREALRIRLHRYPPEAWQVAEVRGVLGGVLRAQGHGEQALPMLEEAFEVIREYWGEHHPLARRARARLSRTG